MDEFWVNQRGNTPHAFMCLGMQQRYLSCQLSGTSERRVYNSVRPHIPASCRGQDRQGRTLVG